MRGSEDNYISKVGIVVFSILQQQSQHNDAALRTAGLKWCLIPKLLHLNHLGIQSHGSFPAKLYVFFTSLYLLSNMA